MLLWDIYTSFSNFKRTGTNRPAILSLIPVLGWKVKPILVSHLTSAYKKHHKRQIPLPLPCQDKLAKKALLVRMHTRAFAALCSVPPAHSYHHDVYKNTCHKNAILWNLHVIRHLYCKYRKTKFYLVIHRLYTTQIPQTKYFHLLFNKKAGFDLSFSFYVLILILKDWSKESKHGLSPCLVFWPPLFWKKLSRLQAYISSGLCQKKNLFSRYG